MKNLPAVSTDWWKPSKLIVHFYGLSFIVSGGDIEFESNEEIYDYLWNFLHQQHNKLVLQDSVYYHAILLKHLKETNEIWANVIM